MSRWLYDPETDSRNGKEFTYNSPIHENDTLQKNSLIRHSKSLWIYELRI